MRDNNIIRYIRIGVEFLLAFFCMVGSTVPRLVGTDISRWMMSGMFIFGCLPFIEFVLIGVGNYIMEKL